MEKPHEVIACHSSAFHTKVWVSVMVWALAVPGWIPAEDRGAPWSGVGSGLNQERRSGRQSDGGTVQRFSADEVRAGNDAPANREENIASLEQLIAKAKSGDSSAEFELGMRYARGVGVKQNYEAAVFWYSRAAESGHVPAQVALGECYADGLGVGYDWEHAMYWSMKAAKAGHTMAMYFVGWLYMVGENGKGDSKQMLVWLEKAAESGQVEAQRLLGTIYYSGHGDVSQDAYKAVKWFTEGAKQDDAACLYFLGTAYAQGEALSKNWKVAVDLWTAAAEQGYAPAQYELGNAHCRDDGETSPNYPLAYAWFRLAAIQGDDKAGMYADDLARQFISQEMLAKANALIEQFSPRQPTPYVSSPSEPRHPLNMSEVKGMGTGFFITENGYLVTNAHVVAGAEACEVHLRTNQRFPATVVAQNEDEDLAILKVAVNHQRCLPILSSQSVRLGTSVATVGFPNVTVQGFSPKLSKGDVSALSGIQDNPSWFQISVPIQPGNSGGALFDEDGNVVGVICALLDQNVAIATTGTLASNVAYAVKSNLLLDLISTVPGLNAQLMPPNTRSQKFVEIVDQVEQCTALIFVK